MKALLALLFLCLVACTDREPQVASDPVRDDSVFDPLTETLDRAAGVEQTLQDSAAERRRQLEEAEGR
jgi:hypothetical protein